MNYICLLAGLRWKSTNRNYCHFESKQNIFPIAVFFVKIALENNFPPFKMLSLPFETDFNWRLLDGRAQWLALITNSWVLYRKMCIVIKKMKHKAKLLFNDSNSVVLSDESRVETREDDDEPLVAPHNETEILHIFIHYFDFLFLHVSLYIMDTSSESFSFTKGKQCTMEQPGETEKEQKVMSSARRKRKRLMNDSFSIYWNSIKNQ